MGLSSTNEIRYVFQREWELSYLWENTFENNNLYKEFTFSKGFQLKKKHSKIET